MDAVSGARKRMRESAADLVESADADVGADVGADVHVGEEVGSGGGAHRTHTGTHTGTHIDDKWAALVQRCGPDVPDGPWRAAAVAAGVEGGADGFLCHLGRTVCAALDSIPAQAEAARARLRSTRASLVRAVNARFDELEARVDDAHVAKAAALDRELCAVDVVLERLRGERQAVTDAMVEAEAERETEAEAETRPGTRVPNASDASDASNASDAIKRLGDRHADLSARLDQADAMLLALPPVIVEPPRIDLVLDETALSALYAGVAALGSVFAPRAAATVALDMCANAGNAAIFEAGCLELAAHAPELLQAAVDAGLCSVLVKALASRCSVAVAERGCTALARVVAWTAGCQAAIDAGAPAALVALLATDHADHAAVAEHACEALFCMAAKEGPGRQAVAEARVGPKARADEANERPVDAISSFVAVMRVHPRNAAVIQKSCDALSRVAEFFLSSPDNPPATMAAAPVALVATLLQNPGDAAVAQAVLPALAITFAFRVSNVAAVEVGAASAIVEAMRVHASSNAAVAMLGGRALADLAFFDQGEHAAVRAGAAAAVTAAFRAHSRDDRVASSCCAALRNTISGNLGKSSAFRSGAIEVVTEALLAFPTHESLVEDGCGVLARLTENNSGVNRVVDSDVDAVVVSRVIDALAVFPSNAIVASEGCNAIGNINVIIPGPARAEVFNAFNAFNVVVAAMRAHAASAEIVTQACRALFSLAGWYESGAGGAGAAKEIEETEEAEDAEETEREEQQQQQQQHSDHANAMSAMLDAVRAHADNSAVVAMSCRALSVFVVRTAGQQAAVDMGAPAVLVDLLYTYASVATVAKLVCDALARIAVLPAGKQAATDAGALDAVLGVLRANPSGGPIVAAATRALEAVLAFSARRKHAVIGAQTEGD